MPSLRLRLVDEHEVLPAFANPHALMARAVTRGRCELLPAVAWRASTWHRGCFGPRAGSTALAWNPDPVVPCRAVWLFRIRSAHYIPSFGAVISSGGEVMQLSIDEARFVTPDLAALPGVRKQDDDMVLDLAGASVPTLAKAAVTLSWGGILNYGHFLLDCVTGASLLRDTPGLGGHSRVFPRLQDWQRRHLELAEVAPLELADPIYHVSDLVFTSCMAHFLGTPNVNYRRLRERQLRNHRATGETPTRIYVSRRGRVNRQFVSENALEDRLRAAGFAVILPEELPVDQQIRSFHQSNRCRRCKGEDEAQTARRVGV